MKTSKFLLILLGLVLMLDPPALSQSLCSGALAFQSELADQKIILSQMLSKNVFNTNRGLTAYIANFGYRFEQIVSSLSSRQRWLDAGAGKAKAQIDLIESRYNELLSPVFGLVPDLVAVVVSKPVGAEIPKDPHLRYLEGRMIEDILPAEIGQFDLITDLYGPFSYSTHPENILAYYLKVLRPQGKLFIRANFNNRAVKSTQVIDRQNRRISILEWMQRIPGIHVSFSESTGSLMLELVEPSKIAIPRLELLDILQGAPPTRLYQEI